MNKYIVYHICLHTGENSFQCPYSEFLHFLQKHAIKIAPGIWACPFCPMNRKTSFDMESHIRTHTGEKPFQCPYCEQTFNQKGNCDRHINNRHTGEKPFACNFCDYSAIRKDLLAKHIQSKHY